MPGEHTESPAQVQQRTRAILAAGDATLRAFGYPTGFLRDRFAFLDDANEWRRLFAELLGTLLLVFAAVGGGLVNARFGGTAVPAAAQVAAPGLMVGVIILAMGSVSGAHLNPAVTLAFTLRGDFPWKRVPGYLVAQAGGALLATALLLGLLGRQGAAGLTLPGPGITPLRALLWEAVLSFGLVTTILGTSSGAQNVGPLNALGVAAYLVLAGLVGAPVSGAAMNPVRSLGPALVLNAWTAWWAYLLGPLLGAVVAVLAAWVLRGAGGGFYGKRAAQGALGWLWHPGPVTYAVPNAPPADEAPGASPTEPARSGYHAVADRPPPAPRRRG